MDFRYYPYSFPMNVEQPLFDERLFPGGGFGPPGYPQGGQQQGGFPPVQQPGFPPVQQPGFPPGQTQGFPTGFQPGQPQGFPTGQHQGFPQGQQSGFGQQDGPPSSPPPSFTPQMQQASTFAVDPGGIRRCLHRFTYIWMDSGRSFWFYPVFVGRNSIAGWRWKRNRWVYFGTDLRSIRSFQCV